MTFEKAIKKLKPQKTEKEKSPEAIDAKVYRTYSREVYTPLEFRMKVGARNKQREKFLAAIRNKNTSDENTFQEPDNTLNVSFREQERTFTELGSIIERAKKLRQKIESENYPQEVKDFYPDAIKEQELIIEMAIASKFGNMEKFQKANNQINSLPKSELVTYTIHQIEDTLKKAIAKTNLSHTTKNQKTGNHPNLYNLLTSFQKKLTDSFSPMLTEHKTTPLTYQDLKTVESIHPLSNFISNEVLAPIGEAWHFKYEDAMNGLKIVLKALQKQKILPENISLQRAPGNSKFSINLDNNDKETISISAPLTFTTLEHQAWIEKHVIPFLQKHYQAQSQNSEEFEETIKRVFGFYTDKTPTNKISDTAQEFYILDNDESVQGSDFINILGYALKKFSKKSKVGEILKKWKITTKGSDRYTLAINHLKRLIIVRPYRAFKKGELLAKYSHEFTHILDAAYGAISKFHLLEKGLAQTKSFTEGKATLIEKVAKYTNRDYKLHPENKDSFLIPIPRIDYYFAISYALGIDQKNKVRSFQETFNTMTTYYIAELLAQTSTDWEEEKLQLNAQDQAYQTCQRVYDGTDGKTAVNTTDLHYAEGFLKILSLIRSNPEELNRLIRGGRCDLTNESHRKLLDKLGINLPDESYKKTTSSSPSKKIAS